MTRLIPRASGGYLRSVSVMTSLLSDGGLVVKKLDRPSPLSRLRGKGKERLKRVETMYVDQLQLTTVLLPLLSAGFPFVGSSSSCTR
jgi:hypothetical protein